MAGNRVELSGHRTARSHAAHRCRSHDTAWKFSLSFYPEVTPERCTVAVLLEIDPIGLMRSNKRRIPGLDQYVNDRPYVASSLMSVALNAAFSTAMNGRSKDRPERVAEKMNLSATVAAVRCNAGGDLITHRFHNLSERIQYWRGNISQKQKALII